MMAAAIPALSTPTLAKECRMPSSPPALRFQQTDDCQIVRNSTKPAKNNDRATVGEAGFIDLGNGTQVRIQGRIRTETLYKR
jgi:hypothetical protein